ncbi:hypothetical protein AVEN_26227-1 [Araneus ventricosus]|uniref:Uncharacterized protein n=1 Tax=Araneus ventricosus TaxID=182803 RepID=A0A4Y2AND5_ARAVE|nr:hypothetical protein AVEN_26227-1 [Araneus ventricosus]
MLQHLQLVWMPLISPQNAHDPALTDSHLSRETSDTFCQTFDHHCYHLCLRIFICFYLWSSRSVCIGDGTCPFEFIDKFCYSVKGYTCSVRSLYLKYRLHDGWYRSQPTEQCQYVLPSLVASFFNWFTFMKMKKKLVTAFTICLETYDSPCIPCLHITIQKQKHKYLNYKILCYKIKCHNGKHEKKQEETKETQDLK